MGDQIVERIVAAIADVEGVAPEDLAFSLGEHVDADSLQRFDERTDVPWRLELEIPDYTVAVDESGAVELEPVSPESEASE